MCVSTSLSIRLLKAMFAAAGPALTLIPHRGEESRYAAWLKGSFEEQPVKFGIDMEEADAIADKTDGMAALEDGVADSNGGETTSDSDVSLMEALVHEPVKEDGNEPPPSVAAASVESSATRGENENGVPAPPSLGLGQDDPKDDDSKMDEDKKNSIEDDIKAASWGVFRITLKRHGLQASCPFHKRNDKTGCKKTIRIIGEGAAAKREALRLLMWWCICQQDHNRQRSHVGYNPVRGVVGPDDFILASEIFERPQGIRTDDELDAIDVAKDVENQRGGAGRARGRGRRGRGGRGRRGSGGGGGGNDADTTVADVVVAPSSSASSSAKGVDSSSSSSSDSSSSSG